MNNNQTNSSNTTVLSIYQEAYELALNEVKEELLANENYSKLEEIKKIESKFKKSIQNNEQVTENERKPNENGLN